MAAGVAGRTVVLADHTERNTGHNMLPKLLHSDPEVYLNIIYTSLKNIVYITVCFTEAGYTWHTCILIC